MAWTSGAARETCARSSGDRQRTQGQTQGRADPARGERAAGVWVAQSGVALLASPRRLPRRTETRPAAATSSFPPINSSSAAPRPSSHALVTQAHSRSLAAPVCASSLLHSTLYATTSASTVIAHMYSGSVRLSFCTLNASSSPASPATITNRPTCQSRRQSRFCSPFSRSPLVRTEKFSTIPNTRRSHAHAHTEPTNPALPSIVLGFAANHRCRPSRFPAIDACGAQSRKPSR